jgi:hypothetical protein
LRPAASASYAAASAPLIIRANTAAAHAVIRALMLHPPL